MANEREKIAEARKALRCLYIATEEDVAREVSERVESVIALLREREPIQEDYAEAVETIRHLEDRVREWRAAAEEAEARLQEREEPWPPGLGELIEWLKGDVLPGEVQDEVEEHIAKIRRAVGHDLGARRNTAKRDRTADEEYTLGLRDAAKMGMGWCPQDAGLSENFQTWQQAVGLLVEAIQRKADGILADKEGDDE